MRAREDFRSSTLPPLPGDAGSRRSGVVEPPAAELAAYARTGFLGPLDLLTPAEAEVLADTVEHGARQVSGLMAEDHEGPNRNQYWRDLGKSAFVWFKSLHFYVESAKVAVTSPAILRTASRILDSRDLILWGVELVRQAPGESHRWHTDVECERHGITFWLPLRNVGDDSGIKLMECSHLLPGYPQQLKVNVGLDLNDDRAVLAAAQWARPDARITIPRVAPGQFIVFAGTLWHASFNDAETPRAALVFQISPAGARVRIPRRWEPPLEWHSWVPPVMTVRAPG